MARVLKVILLLLPLVLLAGIPAVASAETESGGGALRITAQQAAPSVSLAGTANAQVRLNAPVSVTATFSEPVSGFTVDDISVVNGTGGNLAGSGAVYTFEVTPDAIGEVTVDIAAGVAADAGGDGNTAAPQFSLGIPYDDDRDGAISRPEVITAIRDYLGGVVGITRAQTIALIRLYLAPPTVPGPDTMVSHSLTPGEELMVEHPSGAMIMVPRDATAAPSGEELMVAIREVDPPEGSVLPGEQVYDISVTGQEGLDAPLREPVEITLPYTLPEGKNAADVVLLHWDHQLGRWEEVEGAVVDEAAQTVTAEVTGLSDHQVSFALSPFEFLGTALVSLVGAEALGDSYDAGFKHLVTLHASEGVRFPYFPAFRLGKVGASLAVDVDDLVSLPMVGIGDPLTVEGASGFVTFGLNGNLGLSAEAVGVDAGVSFTIPETGKYRSTAYNNDVSFDNRISAVTVSIPQGEASFLTVNANGNFSPADAQLGTCLICKTSVKAGVTFLDTSFNLLKGEFNTNIVNRILADFQKPGSDQCQGGSPPEEGVSLTFFSGELLCKLFSKVGDAAGTLFTETIYHYTDYEDQDPEEVKQLDAAYFNRVYNVWGGKDINGDAEELGDLVFPGAEPALPLTIMVLSDRYEERKYFVELVELTEGWSIEPTGDWYTGFDEDPDDAIFRVDFEMLALDLGETGWLATATEDAPNMATAQFRLVHDKSALNDIFDDPLGLGFDVVVDNFSFPMWQERPWSDLSLVATATPDPVASGETLTYTARVENLGPEPAANVELTMLNLVGQGLVLEDASSGQRALACDTSALIRGFSCSLGRMEVGELIELTLEFELAVSLHDDVPLNAPFVVESDQEDLNPGNNSATVETGVRFPDRAALVALYQATGGPNWRYDRNWLTHEPIGDWFGVTTDAAGRVIGLDLYYNGLSGYLPAELGDLTSLQHLLLTRNQLTGEIPPDLGGLASLQRLYLSSNRLTGEVPPELGGLTSLRELSLQNNMLSGPVPGQLTNLTNLTTLLLAANDFSGCMPEGLADVANNDLDELGLEDCGQGNEAFASVSAGGDTPAG